MGALNRIGIEQLSVFGLPPLEFVALAGDLGCGHISIGLESGRPSPLGFPGYSLCDNATLRTEMIAAMRDRGVAISLGEGMVVRPGVDVADTAADLDILCELGVARINTVSLDPDLSRSFDQFAILAGMAASRGIETTVEFCPALPVDSLATALQAVEHVGRDSFRVMIDTMHLCRSDGGMEAFKALDPALIGYAQFCDCPMTASHDTYMEEAMIDRLPPGAGELPLAEIAAMLPGDTIVGLEIPMLQAALSGAGLRELLRPCVETVRAML